MRELRITRDLEYSLCGWSRSRFTVYAGTIVTEILTSEMSDFDRKPSEKFRSNERKENGRQVVFFNYYGRPRSTILGDGAEYVK